MIADKARMRRLLAALILLFLLITPIWIRISLEVRTHLARAEQAASTDRQSREAVDELRRALQWDVPGMFGGKAAQRELTHRAFDDTAPKEDQAYALRALLRGLRSGRSWLYPMSAEEPLVMRINSALRTLEPQNFPNVSTPVNDDVNYRAQFLSHCFFWGWIAAVFFTIARGFEPSGRIRLPMLLTGLCGTTLCYFLWIAALRELL